MNITGIFAQNSEAMGYFLILYSEGGIPEHFEAVTRFPLMLMLFTSVSNMALGNYSIAMFDIEGNNGLPSTRAAINSSVEILDGSNRPQGMTLF